MAIGAIVIALVCGVFIGRWSYDAGSWIRATTADVPVPSTGKYQ